MRDDIRMAINLLRSIQTQLELDYNDFRTNSSPGEELEDAIIALEEWGV